MGAKRIAIVSIPVKEPDRARAFYCDKLGFEVVRDQPMGPGRRWLQIAPPGAQTSLTLVTWFDDMPPGSVRGLVLEVPTLDELHRRLESDGVTVSKITAAVWGRYATLQDPDGNGLVLQEAPR
jgi:catechol 2,3-dioxygenase-like lactoylglutathione lyase family enzyme